MDQQTLLTTIVIPLHYVKSARIRSYSGPHSAVFSPNVSIVGHVRTVKIKYNLNECNTNSQKVTPIYGREHMINRAFVLACHLLGKSPAGGNKFHLCPTLTKQLAKSPGQSTLSIKQKIPRNCVKNL